MAGNTDGWTSVGKSKKMQRMAYDGNEKASQKWSDLFAKRAAPGREGWFFAIDNPRLRRRIHDTYMGGRDPMSWLRAEMGWNAHAAAAPIPRALEIGCGAGDLALTLMTAGWFTRLDAFDVAEGAVGSGKARAAAAGLDGLHFAVADGNTMMLQPGSYDFIYACHSLHHITDLEHLFAQCAAALRPGGVMFATDYVGPSRMQYSDRHLALMNEMLARLPPEKRVDNMHDFREKLLVRRTPLDVFDKYDPSEAPRSAEILQVLGQFFDVQVQHYGMELTYEVLLGIVHNFDPDDPADNATMDRLFELDRAAAGIEGVDPLFANLIARPRERTRPVAVPAAVAVPDVVPVVAPIVIPCGAAPGPAASALAAVPGPGRAAQPDFLALVSGQGGADAPPAAGLVDGLEGWLAPDAADLTLRLCRLQAALGLRTGVLELGVYRGKYLALLAAAHEGTGAPVVGVDMFIERVGEPIPAEHVAHFAGLISDNVRRVAPGAAPVVVASNTRALDAAGLLAHCPARYSYISVDAGHEAEDVVHDLTLAASVLSAGGIVALDDAFYGPLPGVTEGLFRWLAGPADGGLAAFAHCGRKLFLCRPDMHPTWLAYAGWLLTRGEEAGYLAQSAALARQGAAVGFRPRVAGWEIVAFGDVVPVSRAVGGEANRV